MLDGPTYRGTSRVGSIEAERRMDAPVGWEEGGWGASFQRVQERADGSRTM